MRTTLLLSVQTQLQHCQRWIIDSDILIINYYYMVDVKNSKILIISDQQIPYHHPDMFKFLKALNDEYKFDRVLNIGDELDQSGINFHDKDPDAMFSPSEELETSIRIFSNFFDIFPNMDILDSNHGSLVYRKGKWAGIPRTVFKSWGEILEVPSGYVWHNDLYVKMSNGQTLYLHHGTAKGKNELITSQRMGMCYVQGHYHGRFALQYWSNGLDIFWGATIGCMVDCTNRAFSYGKDYTLKPVLGVLIILDGVPILIPLRVNNNNRWDGSI